MPNKRKVRQSRKAPKIAPPALVQIATKTTGSPDPPALSSRPWNRAILTGTFITGGVGGAPVTAATISSELVSQVVPGATPANLEFRLRRIDAWGQELITGGVSYQSAVALDIFPFIGVGSGTALSLQDAPAANHRAHVHALIAPYVINGARTDQVFQAQVASGQSAMVHLKIDWRLTGSEGAGPLFKSVIPLQLQSPTPPGGFSPEEPASE